MGYLTLEVRHGKTNRSIVHCDDQNPTDTVKIEKLIIGFVENEENKKLIDFIEPLVAYFEDCLSECKNEFFRGLDFNKKILLENNHIGPSPKPSDNRYNKDSEKCLYLIDDKKFLFTEFDKSSSLLVQKYKIPVETMKIADLSPNNEKLHNSLGLLFDMAERGMTASGYRFELELEQRQKSKYLFSQTLASVFKNYGWEGLYIPGVHGSKGQHYNNLAIFTPSLKQWESWINGEIFLEGKK